MPRNLIVLTLCAVILSSRPGLASVLAAQDALATPLRQWS
jgi:hypothetical protein